MTCPRCSLPLVCRHCYYDRPGKCPVGVRKVMVHTEGEGEGMVTCRLDSKLST